MWTSLLLVSKMSRSLSILNDGKLQQIVCQQPGKASHARAQLVQSFYLGLCIKLLHGIEVLDSICLSRQCPRFQRGYEGLVPRSERTLHRTNQSQHSGTARRSQLLRDNQRPLKQTQCHSRACLQGLVWHSMQHASADSHPLQVRHCILL